MRSGILASVILLGLAPARADQGSDDDVDHTVAAGESCLSIAAVEFPGDANALAELHALNPQLGPLPHHLAVGQKLRVRGAPDARLTFVRPRVDVRPRGKPAWLEARPQEGLRRQDELTTRTDGRAELLFSDQTVLQVAENTLVVIYGAVTKLPGLARKSGPVELVEGDLRLHLGALRGEPATVATPGAQVTARSNDIQVSVDKARMSRVAVFDGDADVQARGAQVKVKRGFGTRVAEGKPPEPPQPLPAAPPWHGADHEVVLLVDADSAPVTLAWAPVATAARYRVELARDAAMNDAVVATTIAEGSLVTPAVPVGRYFARVAGVNAAGLLGMPSVARTIDVVRAHVQTGAQDRGAVAGTALIELAVAAGPDFDVTLDGKPAPAPIVVRGVGAHELVVTPHGASAGGARLACRIAAPRATVAIEPGFAARVELSDDAGRPLALAAAPELSLRGRGTTRVGALAPAGAGWRADVSGPGHSDLEVEALWGDTVIGAAAQHRPPPHPVAIADPAGTPTGILDAQVPITPWLPTGPSLVVAAQAAADGDHGYRVDVVGETPVDSSAAIRVGAVSRAGGDDPLGPELDVGGRLQVLDRLVLALDAGFPFDGATTGGRQLLRVRPSAALGVDRGDLALATTQGVIIHPGEHELLYQGGVVAAWRPVPAAALLAGVDALAGNSAADQSLFALAAAGGARVRCGDLEAGLALRLGVGPDAADVWGRFSVLLSLEYRGWAAP